MAHHLTTEAESQLSPTGRTISIGYYETPAGSLKVFTETIVDPTDGHAPTSPDVLTELEAGFDGAVGGPAGSAPQPVWAAVPTGARTSVMRCESVTQLKIPIRACVFVEGSTVGVIGVYRPSPSDALLIDEVRRAIAGS